MVTTLKNNNMLRLRRDKLFDKDRREIVGNNSSKTKPYKHLTKSELKEVRAKLKEEKKVENLKKISVVILLVLFIGIMFYLFLFHFDPGRLPRFR